MNKSTFAFKKYQQLIEPNRQQRKIKDVNETEKYNRKTNNRSELLKKPLAEFKESVSFHTEPSLLPTLKAKKQDDTQKMLSIRNQSLLYEESEKRVTITKNRNLYFSPTPQPRKTSIYNSSPS